METRLLSIAAGILLCLCTGFGMALAQPQQVEVFCDNDYAPYSYASEGEAAGIYTEILTRAFDRMEGYRVEITPVPWRKGMSLMKTGRGFALYPPYFRPKVRPFMDYPASVLNEGYSVIGNTDLAQKEPRVWPDDFKGMTVGINAGYSVPELERARAMGVIIREGESSRENIAKLAAGDVDAYINDKTAVFWTIKQMKAQGGLEPNQADALAAVMEISREQGYLGFTNRDEGRFPFRSDFIRKFVAEIQRMKENGEIQEILDAYVE